MNETMAALAFLMLALLGLNMLAILVLFMRDMFVWATNILHRRRRI